MIDVKGRWALITGASRGIGYLAAIFMAKQGCNLILHGRTEEHLEKVLKEVRDLASVYDGTDVMINLTDPGWCRTDLGGEHAPNAPESALPGVVVGAFIDDKKSGRCFGASNFYGMSLEEAVKYAEKNIPAYLGSLD